MANVDLHLSLPEEMKSFIEAEVEDGHFGTPGAYLRDLIAQEQERRRERLEAHLLRALDSGTIEMTAEDLDAEDFGAVLRAKQPAQK